MANPPRVQNPWRVIPSYSKVKTRYRNSISCTCEFTGINSGAGNERYSLLTTNFTGFPFNSPFISWQTIPPGSKRLAVRKQVSGDTDFGGWIGSGKIERTILRTFT